MSTREMAINIFNTLTEEQLVGFIKTYSKNSAENKAEDPEQKELEECKKNFERLDKMVDENSHFVSDIGDNDKEIPAVHCEENNTKPAAKKRTKREAYEHLKMLIEKNAYLFADAEDNDKEVLQKHREEKYGT